MDIKVSHHAILLKFSNLVVHNGKSLQQLQLKGCFSLNLNLQNRFLLLFVIENGMLSIHQHDLYESERRKLRQILF